MKPIDIAKLAVETMAQPGTLGVTLVIPKGKFPKGFPRGNLLNEMVRNGRCERLYSFDPDKVLAYLVNNRFITIERAGANLIIKPGEMGDEDEQ